MEQEVDAWARGPTKMTGSSLAVNPLAGLRLHPRSKYGALFVAATQRALTYRMAIALGATSSLVLFGLQFSLWRSVFQSEPQISGFDWPTVQTYLTLSFCLNLLLSTRSEEAIY